MIDLLRKRMQQVSAANAVQEEQALKEMLQEVALYALWRGGFFKIGAFQGGTSLRILHGLPRFPKIWISFCLRLPGSFAGRITSNRSPKCWQSSACAAS